MPKSQVKLDRGNSAVLIKVRDPIKWVNDGILRGLCLILSHTNAALI